MTTFFDSLDIDLALIEHGHSNGGHNGMNAAAGERAIAAANRVVGTDQLREVIDALFQSYHNTGWDGRTVHIQVCDDLDHDGASGREYVLRGAAVDIQFTATLGHQDLEAVDSGVSHSAPDEAVTHEAGAGGTVISRVRFMTNGEGHSGEAAARDVLESRGFEVESAE